MKAWRRAGRHLLCGFCGRIVEPSEIVLVLKNARVKREAYRCSQPRCCEDRVPQDVPPLPARVVPVSFTKRMVPLKKALERFDWKREQAEPEKV